ncbi:MAG: hypothetical protein ACE5IY_09935 [bacterium]
MGGIANVNLIFALHLASTFVMLGLIWFIQLVHYPLLAQISRYRAGAYHQTRMRLATWVFGPPMVTELITAVLLVWRPAAVFPVKMAWVGLALLGVIWLATAFLQAPRHEILAIAFVEETHRKLVSSNWIRTVAWTVRGVLLCYFLLMNL